MAPDKCLICGEIIPEGIQVCKNCMEEYGIDTGADTEVVEELRDVANVLKITEGTDTNIKQSMESLLNIADRIERREKKCSQSKRK